jgi:hypothetical protein
MRPRSLAILLVAAAACGTSARHEICAPWDGLGLPPPAKVYDCSATYLSMSLGDAAHDDEANRATMLAALQRSGFHEIVTRAPAKGDTRAVVRRDRDHMQLSIAAVGGTVDLRPDTAPALTGSLEDARREVAELRASFAPLAAAFPASLARPRACDDALLLRLDPELATRPIRFFDVDALDTPSRSKAGGRLPHLLDALPSADPSAADEVVDLIRLQALLPALRAQRVVVGYRATVLDTPSDNADAVDMTEKGEKIKEGTFTPGRFAAELVVFDRAAAKPLCWTTVTATNSAAVRQEAYEDHKIWTDFYDNVAASVADGLHTMSKSLRVAP